MMVSNIFAADQSVNKEDAAITDDIKIKYVGPELSMKNVSNRKEENI